MVEKNSSLSAIAPMHLTAYVATLRAVGPPPRPREHGGLQ